MKPTAFKELPDGDEIAKGEKHLDEHEATAVIKIVEKSYFGVSSYAACICGRACWRACLAHLDKKGVLSKRH